MKRLAGLWVVLFVGWILLSWHWTPLFLFFGALTCTVAVWASARLGVVDRESLPAHLAWRLAAYLPWLVWEIAKSNLRVTRIVLSPRMRLSPSIVHFQGSQRTDLGRFVYANSITLTPGTVTTGVVGNDFEVHAIASEEVDGSEENVMNRKVARLEGEAG